jgi:hypothetical protein
VGLSALNAGLLIASAAWSSERAAVVAGSPVPPSSSSGSPRFRRSVPNAGPTWSAPGCAQQLAEERRQLSRLERLAAQLLPLRARFDRGWRPNPALQAEVADVLLRLGAPPDAAPECRGSLCRVKVPASVERGLRTSDWARDNVMASASTLEGQSHDLFFETRDRATDGNGFLSEVWQAFVSTGVPSRCWRLANGTSRLNVVLGLVDEEGQPAGPPRLTAHYYGPGVGDDVIRCVSDGFDRHAAGVTVAETLLPARLSRQLPKDL